jgi:hypothetical protein
LDLASSNASILNQQSAAIVNPDVWPSEMEKLYVEQLAKMHQHCDPNFLLSCQIVGGAELAGNGSSILSKDHTHEVSAIGTGGLAGTAPTTRRPR